MARDKTAAEMKRDGEGEDVRFDPEDEAAADRVWARVDAGESLADIAGPDDEDEDDAGEKDDEDEDDEDAG